jgi:D-serine deaminase-like pyridoxal phosphate-dependent protein
VTLGPPATPGDRRIVTDCPGWAGGGTPYLLVDADLVARNVADMAAFAAERGLALRPHAKTHKTVEAARLQLGAGAVGLTVATVAEGERFAAAGVDDLFIGYPLWVDAAKGARLRALRERATVTVGTDSVEAARALAAQAPGTPVMVEVDSGQHRSGVAPGDAGAVAVGAARAGLDVRGVFTFPGHSYAPGRAPVVAAEEAVALGTAVASLRRAGLPAEVVSGGSTPSAHDVDERVLTELRPGVYVFGDAQQWELGTTTPDRIALSAVATVVSRAGGRVVVDAGSKTLGADRADYATGYGRLLDHPDARITMLAEHHAVVAWDDSPPPEPGSRLRVVPNHVCAAVNLADELVLTDGGRWPVVARGANT